MSNLKKMGIPMPFKTLDMEVTEPGLVEMVDILKNVVNDHEAMKELREEVQQTVLDSVIRDRLYKETTEKAKQLVELQKNIDKDETVITEVIQLMQEIAKNLLTIGMPIESIAEVTGLPIEMVITL